MLNQCIHKPVKNYAQVPDYLANDVYEFITNNEAYSHIDAVEYINKRSVIFHIIGNLNYPVE